MPLFLTLKKSKLFKKDVAHFIIGSKMIYNLCDGIKLFKKILNLLVVKSQKNF